MSSILLVTSSPRADSLSTAIATELAEKLKMQKSGSTIIARDLAQNPPRHIDQTFTNGIYKPADSRTPEEAAAVDQSDKLVDELLAADTLVIATGLINFGMSSTLKSWIDHIARAGRTFKYTETGPVGLAGDGKKAYIVLASGGVYSEGPAMAFNHAVPHLKSVLNFIGIQDVETIYVEGLALGQEAAQKAIEAAKERANDLAKAA